MGPTLEGLWRSDLDSFARAVSLCRRRPSCSTPSSSPGSAGCPVAGCGPRRSRHRPPPQSAGLGSESTAPGRPFTAALAVGCRRPRLWHLAVSGVDVQHWAPAGRDGIDLVAVELRHGGRHVRGFWRLLRLVLLMREALDRRRQPRRRAGDAQRDLERGGIHPGVLGSERAQPEVIEVHGQAAGSASLLESTRGGPRVTASTFRFRQARWACP